MKKNRLFSPSGIIFFFFLLFVAFIGYKYVTYRNAIFPYDVQRDYAYEFYQANNIKVSITEGHVTIPDSINENCTAILKVNVGATFWGKWSQPHIKIKSEINESIEYLEDGVSGIRYINISPLLNSETNVLSFEGYKVTIEDQQSNLYYYNNKNLERANILVIATHPDDAEIAAYGLYSKYASNTFVLNIKSGESGPFKYDEVYSDTVDHYRKKGQLRTWNSITIPLLGGIAPNNTLNLGYFSDLQEMNKSNPKDLRAAFTKTTDIDTYRQQNISYFRDSLVEGSNWNSLVKNLEIILSIVKPDVIVTPYPAIDMHQDHKYTTIALIEALKNSKTDKGDLYLYTNHYPNGYYPYGKTGALVSLPPNFTEPIYFESLMSNTLDPPLQRDKLFALEAMHDLRPDTEWRFGFKAIKNALKTAKTEFLNGNNTYFDLAVRNNELFFLVPVKQIYNEDVVERIIGNHSIDHNANVVQKSIEY